MEDTLPSGLTLFSTITLTQGASASGIVCAIGTVNVGQVITVTVRASVDGDWATAR